jgi:heme exporter protein A
MIEMEDLGKVFGSRWVLRGLNLRVEGGEFITILGPNGSGKTTLLKVLATLLRPSRGKIRIGGRDMKDGAKVRRLLGFVGHEALLYEDLTSLENLRFYARMYDVPGAEARIKALAEEMDLAAFMAERVRHLSHGLKKRLSIARALLHNPPVLLLDEPDTGLDQKATAILLETLERFVGERTVVMTTHNLERGLEMGDRVVILSQGKITYEGRKPLDPATFPETYFKYTGTRL